MISLFVDFLISEVDCRLVALYSPVFSCILLYCCYKYISAVTNLVEEETFLKRMLEKRYHSPVETATETIIETTFRDEFYIRRQ